MVTRTAPFLSTKDTAIIRKIFPIVKKATVGYTLTRREGDSMAIVKTMHNANGGTVMIADDCCTGLSAEELERRRLAISRAILDIDRKCQLMDMQKREGEDT